MGRKVLPIFALPLLGEGGPSRAMVGRTRTRAVAPSVTRFSRATVLVIREGEA